MTHPFVKVKISMNTPKQGMCRSKLNVLNKWEHQQDSTDVNCVEYVDMKKGPTEQLKDQTIAIPSRELLVVMQNPDSDFAWDVAIIPPVIPREVILLFEHLENP